MSGDKVDPNIRDELVRNCSNSKRRSAAFCPERPTKWRPGSVLNPNDPDGRCFTDNTAWDYVVERLKAGEEIELLLMDKPPGKKGYVMKIRQPDGQIIYIKLQLFTPGVICRSFHYSE
jgi:hypothetical protein